MRSLRSQRFQYEPSLKFEPKSFKFEALDSFKKAQFSFIQEKKSYVTIPTLIGTSTF